MAVDYLAAVEVEEGHHEDAESLEKEVIAISTRRFGEQSTQTLHARSVLEVIHYNQGAILNVKRNSASYSTLNAVCGDQTTVEPSG